jgi:hypothetical protein
MSNKSPILNDRVEREEHGHYSKVGAFFHKIQRWFEPVSDVQRDDSNMGMEDQHGSKVILGSGNILIQAINNISLYASKHLNVSVKGNKQEIIAGTHVHHVEEDAKKTHGTQNESERQAAEKLHESNAKIQQARLDAMDGAGDKVSCPVCHTRHAVDEHSDLIDGIFALIRNYMPPFFCFPLDILQKLAQVLISPLLTLKQNVGLSGAKGCGSPACKDGMVESPASAIKAADAAAETAIKAETENINKYSIQLGSGGGKVETQKGDVIYRYGLKKNDLPAYKNKGHHTFPFYWVPAENTKGRDLRFSSRGSAPRVIYAPPQRTHGSVMFDVSNNFTINAGSPGVEIQTSGRFDVKSGDIVMTATNGEAVFGSGNVTTIKGKNVIIDADDKSGDTGFGIQAQHTMVHGSFNVRGDAAFKGHLTTDGSISTPHLIVPSMRARSSGSASSKFCTEGANFLPVAQVVKNSNFTKDLAFRYIFTGYLLSPAGLVSLAMETYDLIMMNILIEPITTGIFAGVGAGLGAVAVTGFIWNFRHNHTICGNDHSHDVVTPKASYWNSRKGWGGERMAGSHIPTPAPAYGDLPSPGPQSKPGACGGGGLYVKDRNENYNVNIDDAFNNLNYVPISITRNGDGTIIPTPRFSITPRFSGIPGIPTGTYPYYPNTIPSLSGECP